MKTILVGDCTSEQRYQMIDPDAPSEAEFEATVAKALSCVYPKYRCLIFGGSFRLDDRCYRPDLALVALDFSHWFIVEVELASHSLAGHVLPQVRAFRYGDPQLDCVSVLAREIGVSRAQATTLLEFVPRSVAVIANKRDSRWEAALTGVGVQLVSVSAFRSDRGVEAVELDGNLEVTEENLGFGKYSATDRSLRFPRAVRLPTGTIQINDPSGSVGQWTVVENGESLWVTKKIGTPSIPDSVFVQLIRTVGGGLSLRYHLASGPMLPR